MGCSPSKYLDNEAAKRDPDVLEEKLKNQADEKLLQELKLPPPKLRLEIGTGVKKYEKSKTIPRKSVVFLFGGPGSMKGLIADELEEEFGFNIITATDIVISYLPNKVANTVTTVAEIQELLRNDPKLLTVEWIMNLISAKISTSSQQLFLIDIVPSLTSIQKGDSYSKAQFTQEMNNFERRHPVLFAFNMIATTDVLGMKTGPGLQMKPRDKDTDKDKDKDKQDTKSNSSHSTTTTNGTTDSKDAKDGDDDDDDKEEKDKKKDANKVSLFATGSDEADSSRLQRRNDQYRKCALPFLEYFSETSRVATLHISTRKKAYICQKACKFFIEQGYTRREQIRVVLFVFDMASVVGLDTCYYKMNKINLSSIVSEDDQTLEQMVKHLRKHIEQTTNQMRNYLVYMDNLNFEKVNKYRQINFLEVQEGYLDKYIKVKSSQVPPTPYKLPFKSISSINDEVCMFPQSVDTDMCKQIAFVFSRAPRVKEQGTTANEDNANTVTTTGTTPTSHPPVPTTVVTVPSATDITSVTTTTTDHTNGLIPGRVPQSERPSTTTTRLSSSSDKRQRSAGKKLSFRSKRNSQEEQTSSGRSRSSGSSAGSKRTDS